MATLAIARLAASRPRRHKKIASVTKQTGQCETKRKGGCGWLTLARNFLNQAWCGWQQQQLSQSLVRASCIFALLFFLIKLLPVLAHHIISSIYQYNHTFTIAHFVRFCCAIVVTISRLGSRGTCHIEKSTHCGTLFCLLYVHSRVYIEVYEKDTKHTFPCSAARKHWDRTDSRTSSSQHHSYPPRSHQQQQHAHPY